MGRESRSPILLRFEALQENHLVALETGKIKPAVVRAVGETIDLTNFVAVNEICRNKVLGVNRLRITHGQRCGFDRSSNRPPDVDFGEAMLQSLLRFRRRQVVPRTARARLRGVIVMYHPDVVSGAFFTLLREPTVANLVVEDHYLL